MGCSVLGDFSDCGLVFMKPAFLGKGPISSSYPTWGFSVPRDTIPSFICSLVFSWVDLEVDWETQLVFSAFLGQRVVMVEGLTQVLQLHNGQSWLTFYGDISLAVAAKRT